MWSLAHDGSGPQWTLSSELHSDFAFEKDADKFYQPHDVLQLPNGNILLIDDGASPRARALSRARVSRI